MIKLIEFDYYHEAVKQFEDWLREQVDNNAYNSEGITIVIDVAKY